MLILLVLFSILRAHASPVSGGTVTDPTILHTLIFGIQPRVDGTETSTRTLYDIIRSCLFTIAACVYRAIHQNIPDPTMSFWGRLRVRVKITIYALIAPEMMIWWAMRQRFGAIKIACDINQLKPELNWGQTHGHFAQMGGFARKDNKFVLFPADIIKLITEGRIDVEQLVLTKEDIDDKSKGDILSKTLVAFQTTWFVFECITRLAQKLPLLKLEVVTLAFAVLNIITYALWWFKPLNVNRPIYIHVRPEQELVGVQDVPHKRDDEEETAAPDESTTLMAEGEHNSVIDLPGSPVSTPTDDPNESLLSKTRAAIGQAFAAIKADFAERAWWETLAYWLLLEPWSAIVQPLLDLYEDDRAVENVTHVSTFYGMKIPEHEDNMVVRLSSVIGMIFGAIHFLSWDTAFESHTQLLLWRISSVALITEPSVILLINLVVSMDSTGSDGTVVGIFATWFVIVAFAFCIMLGSVMYVLARFCMLILAFLTLRDIPPQGLETISWTSYIPHL